MYLRNSSIFQTFEETLYRNRALFRVPSFAFYIYTQTHTLLTSGDKVTFIRGEVSSGSHLRQQLAHKGSSSREVMDIFTTNDHCAIYWEICTDQFTRKTYDIV